MNTVSTQPTAAPSKPAERSRPAVLVVALAIAAVGLGTLAVSAWVNGRPKSYETIPGRPLLEQGQAEFRDDQVGLRFDPPVNWSMQARATAPPDQDLPDRLLVKYKRLIAGLKPGWLKVSVAVADEKVPLEDLACKRTPSPTHKLFGRVEQITIKDVPAVRVTFTGPMNPDQTNPREFRTEVVAVRRGRHVIFFAASYAADDPKCQERIRKAVASADFNQG